MLMRLRIKLRRLMTEASCRLWQLKDPPSPEIAFAVHSRYNDAVQKGREGNWDEAFIGLHHLASEGWAIPGIRGNEGAALLELGRPEEAKNAVEAELKLVDCLDMDSNDRLGRRYVAGPGVANPANARAVVARARSLAEYNLASAWARLADPEQAFTHLNRAIARGFVSSPDDLDALERDRNLGPLRLQKEYESIVAPLRIKFGR